MIVIARPSKPDTAPCTNGILCSIAALFSKYLVCRLSIASTITSNPAVSEENFGFVDCSINGFKIDNLLSCVSFFIGGYSFFFADVFVPMQNLTVKVAEFYFVHYHNAQRADSGAAR